MNQKETEQVLFRSYEQLQRLLPLFEEEEYGPLYVKMRELRKMLNDLPKEKTDSLSNTVLK